MWTIIKKFNILNFYVNDISDKRRLESLYTSFVKVSAPNFCNSIILSPFIRSLSSITLSYSFTKFNNLPVIFFPKSWSTYLLLFNSSFIEQYSSSFGVSLLLRVLGKHSSYYSKVFFIISCMEYVFLHVEP